MDKWLSPLWNHSLHLLIISHFPLLPLVTNCIYCVILRNVACVWRLCVYLLTCALEKFSRESFRNNLCHRFLTHNYTPPHTHTLTHTHMYHVINKTYKYSRRLQKGGRCYDPFELVTTLFVENITISCLKMVHGFLFVCHYCLLLNDCMTVCVNTHVSVCSYLYG